MENKTAEEMAVTTNLQSNNPSDFASFLIDYNSKVDATKDSLVFFKQAVVDAYEKGYEPAIKAFENLIQAENQKHHEELGRFFGKDRNFQGFSLAEPVGAAEVKRRPLFPASSPLNEPGDLTALWAPTAEKGAGSIGAVEDADQADISAVLQEAFGLH